MSRTVPECAECGAVLVKQYIHYSADATSTDSGLPLHLIEAKLDRGCTTVPFGKNAGTELASLSKKQTRAYLEKCRTFLVKYPGTYCALHAIAAARWGGWARKLVLLCDHKCPAELWSCPVHGTRPVHSHSWVSGTGVVTVEKYGFYEGKMH
jgi:hypothetical protein